VLNFDPPELQNELAAAIEIWKQNIDISWEQDIPDSIIHVTDADFDAADDRDQTVTYESDFELGLPKWQSAARITCREFIELTQELGQVELIKNRECLTEFRYLLRVDPANDQATSYLWQTLPDPQSESDRKLQEEYVEVAREADAWSEKLDKMYNASINGDDDKFDESLLEASRDARGRRYELSEKMDRQLQRYCTLRVSLDGVDITCSLTEGLTVFSAAVAAAGDYSKDLPPVSEDLFVEVRYQRPVSRDAARYVADAYLFELSSTLGLEFEVSPRPALEDWEWYPEEGPRIANARLRPLLLGKGMPELLRLYNRAVSASDNETRILYFTKVIEYISQTVIRQQATETIRAKLLSPRSLNPDATFVAELQAMVEEQRVLRKDRESIRQTVIACCETSELAKFAPRFLSKLRGLSPTDKSKDRDEALTQLGYSLSATRNAVAHAKANYEPTGEECPEEQLAAFAECAKLVAQQAIRWYHSRPEDIRVL
jgi:hypothetical protein